MSLSEVAACPTSKEDLQSSQETLLQPLRETQSTPFISMDKFNDEIFSKMSAVQFDAGCSSSSTDLDKLIKFYNEHNDEETLAQWMNIYEEQKLANSIAAASSPLTKKKKEISDSVDDLFHQSPKRTTNPIDYLTKEVPFNRSMDLPIAGRENDGFFALEKCQSADFPLKFELPRKLLRSKEMPNIADVDDDSEY